MFLVPRGPFDGYYCITDLLTAGTLVAAPFSVHQCSFLFVVLLVLLGGCVVLVLRWFGPCSHWSVYVGVLWLSLVFFS